MKIREATVIDKDKWNAFVETESGNFFHYFEWKTIYEIKKWEYIPLLIENMANDIIAIFPVVKIKSILYSRLYSLPEGSSGGFVLKKILTQVEKYQAIHMFIKYINQHYSKSCSTFLIKENLLLNDTSIKLPTELLLQNGFKFQGYTESKLPCTHRLKLTSSFEYDIWYGLWRKDLRNHIRKSQKHGVYVREDKNLQYREYVINMMLLIFKKFNETPPLKEEVILRLTTFKDKTKVWIALQNDIPIAFLICYYMAPICYASKIGYTNSARKHNSTVLLMSEAIRDACKNGYQFFEFGVTNTISLAQWKEQFKPIKIPMRIYEIKYSNCRTFFEKGPGFIKWVLKNKQYIWNHRRQLLKKIVRRKKRSI